ncbi:MAG: TPM domain-containing protein [Spirochaetales bacterium]|nr:TPM domain-containing protein [Spirochaetales bacterium]
MKKRIAILLIVFLSISIVSCTKDVKKYNPVIDEINLLSKSEKKQLSENLIEFKKEFGSEIVILIIDSTHEQTILEYSIDMTDKMKIGRKGIYDGILITLAKDDRQVRIEVGYGLEKIVKDEIAGNIIRNDMLPYFRNGEYYNGLLKAVIYLEKLITENQELVGDLEGVLFY